MNDVNGVGGISHNDAIGSIRDLGYGHDYCRWWRIIFDLFDFAKSMTINVIVFNGTEYDQIGWLLGITHLVPNNNNKPNLQAIRNQPIPNILIELDQCRSLQT